MPVTSYRSQHQASGQTSTTTTSHRHVPSSFVAMQNRPRTHRFLVQTSDVIQDMRVNIMDETTQQVIWYKERFLGDKEILEQLVHNPTNTVCWTIHRPQRGWYIRLSAPSFPPGAFIPLTPLPSTSPFHVEGGLTFRSRTNLPPASYDRGPSSSSASQEAQSPQIHSYPPTPTISVAPPSPTAIKERLDASSKKKSERRPSPTPNPPITQFILSPHAIPENEITHNGQPVQTSFWSKALSLLRSSSVAQASSFTLQRVVFTTPYPISIPPRLQNPTQKSAEARRSPRDSASDTYQNSMSPPPPYAPDLPATNAPESSANTPPTDSLLFSPSNQSSTSLTISIPPPPRPRSGGPAPPPASSSETASALPVQKPILHTPLLTFHDRTPILTVGSLTGLLEIDAAEHMLLGVDISFWVVVALAYLQFLEEKESYIAASSD